MGQSLKQLADDLSLRQLVREPTHRAGNRLDLVLTDMRELCSVSVLPRFTDHHPVHLHLEIGFDVSPPPIRKVWDYKHASWSKMSQALADYPWRELLDASTADDAGR